MEIEHAKAYENGIHFYDNKSGISIVALKDAYGRIRTYTAPEAVKKLKKSYHCQSWKDILLIFLSSLLLAWLLQSTANQAIKMIAVVVFIWLISFLWFALRKIGGNNTQILRYHAAEHKVINYFDRYHQKPADVYDLQRTTSVCCRCGSTMIAVCDTIISFVILSISFLPSIWLKVVGCLLGFVIVINLWGFGFLDFFQKLVLKEPSLEELQVAYEGAILYEQEWKRLESLH